MEGSRQGTSHASRSGRTASTEVCFVAAVESGPLEAETIRPFASLREFGGDLGRTSQCIAVTHRFGPPLARSTRRALRARNVDYLRFPSVRRFEWYHYLNKILALRAAERATSARVMAFLDPDVLVLNEPVALRLPDHLDFTACVHADEGVIGTTGPGSEHERTWALAARITGIDLDSLPWITPLVGAEPIRLYFNGGVFAYRRKTGFSAEFLRVCTQMLKERVGFAGHAENWIEQLALGLAAHRMGLRWELLPSSHDRLTGAFSKPETPRPVPSDTALLHYHEFMQPEHFPRTTAALGPHHPLVARWLTAQGPPANPAPTPWRWASEALRVGRGVPRRLYRSRMAMELPPAVPSDGHPSPRPGPS